MSKNNRAVIKGVGELCPKCDTPMERKQHPEGWSRDKENYFSEWDICTKCRRVQLYEKYRVVRGRQSFGLNQGSLEGLLNNFRDKISKVKTHRPITLFDIPLDYSKLDEGRCPICGNKLIRLRSRPNYICKGKRHPDKKSYVIKEETLNKMLAKNIRKR